MDLPHDGSPRNQLHIDEIYLFPGFFFFLSSGTLLAFSLLASPFPLFFVHQLSLGSGLSKIL